MGDSADNFPGCPGVGEKTAVKLINDFGSVEELISKIPDKEPRENSEQNLPEAVEPAPAPSMSLPTTGKTSN